MDGIRAIMSPVEPSGDAVPKPKNAGEASRQFEALLLGQMLRSAHDSEDSEDQTASTMWDMAAQQFSQVLANNGGFGLSKVIAKGLQKQ